MSINLRTHMRVFASQSTLGAREEEMELPVRSRDTLPGFSTTDDDSASGNT